MSTFDININLDLGKACELEGIFSWLKIVNILQNYCLKNEIMVITSLRLSLAIPRFPVAFFSGKVQISFITFSSSNIIN